jgi:hypothetical protein
MHLMRYLGKLSLNSNGDHDVSAVDQDFINLLVVAGVVNLDSQLVYKYFAYEVTVV